MINRHLGSSFDSFLEEEGILLECQLEAIKRVVALKIKQSMDKRNLSDIEMAKEMGTSSDALRSLLDPEVRQVNLIDLEKAARSVKQHVRITCSEF